MIEKIREYIEANQIFSQEGLVLVGVSGGADSVALLLILKDLGYHIQALHCNFHLRQEESDRDEQFVSELCKKNSIPLLIKNFDAKEYAVRNSISIEMAARDLRYKWFYEVQSQTNAQCIAVAHHKNDQAETLLLNLIRGTGIRGLAGMYPIRNKIARPLLCVTRQEVIDYLAQIKQAHVTDSTNMKKDATRNRIRMDILPLLAAINPNIINTLSETCSIMMSSIPFYDQAVQEELKQVKANDAELNIRALLESKNSAVIIYEWLKDKGFTTNGDCKITR